MEVYDYELERIKERYNHWKKAGYKITYTNLPDRLKVKFVNFSENIPCYIEYLENRIICYGDYGSFIFENYRSMKDPKNVNYKSFDYLIKKVDRNILVTQFDYKVMEMQIEDFIDKYINSNSLDFSEIVDLDEIIKILRKEVNQYNFAEKLEFCCKALGLTEEWYEYFPSTFGRTYTPQILAQLVMMQLIDEDLE